MFAFAKATRANLIPCIRYRNAPAAIEWLCRNFGFEEHLVVPDEHGGIAHAQLSCGNGMLMLGSADETGSAYGRLMRQPNQVGGNTQSIYMVVADADAIYTQALAAGAQIVIEIKDEDYGGRGFTCRDLEGHIWSFGTYDPWDES